MWRPAGGHWPVPMCAKLLRTKCCKRCSILSCNSWYPEIIPWGQAKIHSRHQPLLHLESAFNEPSNYPYSDSVNALMGSKSFSRHAVYRITVIVENPWNVFVKRRTVSRRFKNNREERDYSGHGAMESWPRRVSLLSLSTGWFPHSADIWLSWDQRRAKRGAATTATTAQRGQLRRWVTGPRVAPPGGATRPALPCLHTTI